MNYGIDLVQKLKDMKYVLEIQEIIRKSTRRSLEKQEFLEIIPPVMDVATDPGLRGAEHFEVDFYGQKYKLMGSMIMHKISGASALGKVFAFSPCFRKETLDSKKTGRHLAEFWQIDVEMKGERDKSMKVAEVILRDVIKDVVESGKLKRKLKIPKLPFKRLSYEEIIKISEKLGYKIKYGEEVPWEVERKISIEIGEPFFIVDYPKGSRGFYDKTISKKQISFDLIYPEGYGEAVSGSEREIDPKMVIEKLKEVGEDPKSYEWFIELMKKGSILQTSGFGFGLERLTRFICGLKKIEDATPFPKIPGGYL